MMQKEDGTVVDYTKIFGLLGDWFAEEMYQTYRSSYDGRGRLMLGCPLWGDEHINLFARYCLPSILSPRNRKALASVGTIVIFGKREESPILTMFKHQLREAGVDYFYHAISEEVMLEVERMAAAGDGNGRYWVLGVSHQLTVKMAGWAGASFHMLMPDHVFCDGYFENLLRLSQEHEAIAQNSISATFRASFPIEKHRLSNGSVAVPHEILGSIGLDFLHPHMQPMILNGKDIEDELTVTTTFWAWRAKASLVMYSVHMNAMYLSPKLCFRATPRLPATLDTELPYFIPGEFYVPQATDGMAFIELSSDNKRGYPDGIPWTRFNELFWLRIKFKDLYLPFCRSKGELPAGPYKGLEIGEIERQHNVIMDRLVADKGTAAIAHIAEANP